MKMITRKNEVNSRTNGKLGKLGQIKARTVKAFWSAAIFATTAMSMAMSASAATAPAPSSAENTWNTVMGFFVTWLGRLGGAVALVGGIMFALAIKNDDADAKSRGLMALIAGIVVVAVCAAANMFGFTA
jgi:hypothetical protein